MSEEESNGPLHTVTKPYRSRRDAEMNLIGIAYGAGLLLILIPLLPLLVIIWLLGKIANSIQV